MDTPSAVVGGPRRAPWRGLRWGSRWGAAALALLTSVLVLGPALGRGVVLSYDLAWSPDVRWTPFTLGLGTPAPRAVPSDAVAVALGRVVGAGTAQALVLLGVLVLAGWGSGRLAGRLVPKTPVAVAAAVVAGIWNPFVLERLVVGQWTVLLGYALTPHLLLAADDARQRRTGALSRLAVLLAVAGAGGANTLVMALLAVVPVLLLPRPALRALLAVGVVGAGSAAVWAFPALGATVRSAAVGASAFAPRADTPFGTVVSLLSGGGFWNPAAHPAERGSVALAALATAVAVSTVVAAGRALVRARAAALTAPAVVGTLLALAAVGDPWGAWTGLVASVPGGGLLRDAHKLVAPLVVLGAVGLGVVVARVARRPTVGPAFAVLGVLLPVVLLPGLAWGVQGRLHAVRVPADVRAAADVLTDAPDGVVGLLPWSQYRRYAWNDGRVSLTLAPRMVGNPVLYDDSLPLTAGRVPGEDPVAARVSADIASGTDPFVALSRAGVRYVLVERQAGFDTPAEPLPDRARVLLDAPHVLVVDLGVGGPVPGASPALLAGWAVTGTTWLAVLVAVTPRMLRALRGRRAEGYRLVQSPP